MRNSITGAKTLNTNWIVWWVVIWRTIYPFVAVIIRLSFSEFHKKLSVTCKECDTSQHDIHVRSCNLTWHPYPRKVPFIRHMETQIALRFELWESSSIIPSQFPWNVLYFKSMVTVCNVIFYVNIYNIAHSPYK